MTGEEYISANRGLDEKLERLVRQKAKLAASLRSPRQEDFVDASVRQFCANANARLQACADFEDKRQFLVGHVERVVYNRCDITIVGSVPVQSASGDSKLPFRIEGKIDIKAVRSKAGRLAALEHYELKRRPSPRELKPINLSYRPYRDTKRSPYREPSLLPSTEGVPGITAVVRAAKRSCRNAAKSPKKSTTVLGSFGESRMNRGDQRMMLPFTPLGNRRPRWRCLDAAFAAVIASIE
jgi:hypothetical protein